MKRLFLIFFLLVFTQTYAQKRHVHRQPLMPSVAEMIVGRIGAECLFTNKYNRAQRSHIYPFNKAVTIKLIAFNDTVGFTPVKHQRIIKKRVLQQTNLNAEQRDSLSSLLFNVGFTTVKNFSQQLVSTSGAACYQPRNSILFIDGNGNVFEYLEICFGCQRFKSSSSQISYGTFCDTKYDLLRQFFKEAGIEYGTWERTTIQSYAEIFKEPDTSMVVEGLRNKLNRKTHQGETLDSLNAVERNLFFLLNSKNISWGDQSESGMANFYAFRSGDYYQETLDALKQAGALRYIKVMEASKEQWPNQNIPANREQRRAILLAIINRSNAIWLKLEKELYTVKNVTDSTEVYARENIDNMVYHFALTHKDQLKD